MVFSTMSSNLVCCNKHQKSFGNNINSMKSWAVRYVVSNGYYYSLLGFVVPAGLGRSSSTRMSL